MTLLNFMFMFIVVFLNVDVEANPDIEPAEGRQRLFGGGQNISHNDPSVLEMTEPPEALAIQITEPPEALELEIDEALQDIDTEQSGNQTDIQKIKANNKRIEKEK